MIWQAPTVVGLRSWLRKQVNAVGIVGLVENMKK